jgi:hydrogenase expression/formation protein HypE
MKIGKVSESVLKRSILKQIKIKRQEIIKGAGVGADCAVFAPIYGEHIVINTQNFELFSQEITDTAVVSVLNNLATEGAKPLGIQVSLFLSAEAFESDLKQIMKTLELSCAEHQIQIMGGSTQVVSGCQNHLLSLTGIGLSTDTKQLSIKNIEKPMDLILSKSIGLKGSWLLSKFGKDKLSLRFSPCFLKKLEEYPNHFSIANEAATAIKSGVSYMHDVSESGIFGALWEVAEGAGVGLTVDLKKIPVKQETIEVCEFFGLNPYEIQSTGALLMVAEHGKQVVKALNDAGVEAAIIGQITDSNDRIIQNDDEIRYLDRPKADEIYNVMK